MIVAISYLPNLLFGCLYVALKASKVQILYTVVDAKRTARFCLLTNWILGKCIPYVDGGVYE